MNHKSVLYFVLIILLILPVISCDQDSIFADIAVEPPPVDPRVSGMPTNIVVIGNKIYVASTNSKTIHIYSGENSWSKMNAPAAIRALAASGADETNMLYALAGNDPKNVSLYRYDGSNWEKIGKGIDESYSIGLIFGANGYLFAGMNDGNSYMISCVNDTDTDLTGIINVNSYLTGAAYNGTDYYLSTNGSGIYCGNDPSSPVTFPDIPVTGSEDGKFTGIINVNGTITAVTNDGKIYITGGLLTEFKLISSTSDFKYTGAMSVWKECYEVDPVGDPGVFGWKDSLLLLGVANTGSYNKGYRELTLENGEPLTTEKQSVVIPGGSLSSIKSEDKNKYEASLARYSVHSILQVPEQVQGYPDDGGSPAVYKDPQGWQPRIFASTAANGLYVFNKGRWNAQD